MIKKLIIVLCPIWLIMVLLSLILWPEPLITIHSLTLHTIGKVFPNYEILVVGRASFAEIIYIMFLTLICIVIGLLIYKKIKD